MAPAPTHRVPPHNAEDVIKAAQDLLEATKSTYLTREAAAAREELLLRNALYIFRLGQGELATFTLPLEQLRALSDILQLAREITGDFASAESASQFAPEIETIVRRTRELEGVDLTRFLR